VERRRSCIVGKFITSRIGVGSSEDELEKPETLQRKTRGPANKCQLIAKQ
jgi:hypothetical protein